MSSGAPTVRTLARRWSRTSPGETSTRLPAVSWSSPAALYFEAYDAANGYELWRSDGTSGGTTIVKNINGGALPSYPHGFAQLGNFLYFDADSGTRGSELWRTDGTEANTDEVENIWTGPGNSSHPTGLTAFGGFLYFAADNGTDGVELWRTDGTLTTQVKANINPLPLPSGSANPYGFQALGSFLYFSANDGTNGTELWRTDGTETGTTLFANINTNGAAAPLRRPHRIGRLAVFPSQRWRRAATSSGAPTAPQPTLFADILPGRESSSPGGFFKVRDAFYFDADDGAHGREPWRLGEPAATPAADTTAPKLDLTAKKSAKLGKAVTVTAGCDEACTASATGKIAVKSGGSKKGKSIKLKSATASIAAGQTGKLKLKLSKSSLKKAKAALGDGAKLKAKISVKVTDAAANTSADTLSLKLR